MNEIGGRSSWRRSFVFVIVLSWAVMATSLLVVRASHIFSDVPTTAFYHNAVEWVFNRGITAGCEVGLYCPEANVTRGQMAVFLQKEGQVLTPSVWSWTGGGSSTDFSGDPIVCAQPADVIPTYPQTARIWANFSFLTLGTGTSGQMSITAAYSTDGGTTWLNAGPAAEMRATSSGTWVAIPDAGLVSLSAGTPYRFGIRVDFIIGNPLANYSCQMMGDYINRNPTTSPLSPQQGR